MKNCMIHYSKIFYFIDNISQAKTYYCKLTAYISLGSTYRGTHYLDALPSIFKFVEIAGKIKDLIRISYTLINLAHVLNE